jgi:hypothetical protein
MGGRGSGRWRKHTAKLLVEDALVLDINELRHASLGGTNVSGTITWPTGANIAFDWEGASHGERKIVLAYSVGAGGTRRDVTEVIRLVTTTFSACGTRWWFNCPMSHGDTPCERRQRKLYLPPAGVYFGCRRCHDLAYRSTRKSHEKTTLAALAKKYGLRL